VLYIWNKWTVPILFLCSVLFRLHIYNIVWTKFIRYPTNILSNLWMCIGCIHCHLFPRWIVAPWNRRHREDFSGYSNWCQSLEQRTRAESLILRQPDTFQQVPLSVWTPDHQHIVWLVYDVQQQWLHFQRTQTCRGNSGRKAVRDKYYFPSHNWSLPPSPASVGWVYSPSCRNSSQSPIWCGTRRGTDN